jgi:hypothetical protein
MPQARWTGGRTREPEPGFFNREWREWDAHGIHGKGTETNGAFLTTNAHEWALMGSESESERERLNLCYLCELL